jgi:8-oxo-dGTP diphosphatase
MKLFVGAKGLVHYKGKFLLLRESSAYKDGAEEGKWDVPGGRIEPGEKVREALIREVREESGLSVTPGDLLEVFDGFPRIQGEECHVVRLYFLCEAHSDQVKLSEDHDAYNWVDPEDTHGKELMADIAEMLAEAKKHI